LSCYNPVHSILFFITFTFDKDQIWQQLAHSFLHLNWLQLQSDRRRTSGICPSDAVLNEKEDVYCGTPTPKRRHEEEIKDSFHSSTPTEPLLENRVVISVGDSDVLVTSGGPVLLQKEPKHYQPRISWQPKMGAALFAIPQPLRHKYHRMYSFLEPGVVQPVL
jgi:hypothetical protein